MTAPLPTRLTAVDKVGAHCERSRRFRFDFRRLYWFDRDERQRTSANECDDPNGSERSNPSNRGKGIKPERICCFRCGCRVRLQG